MSCTIHPITKEFIAQWEIKIAGTRTFNNATQYLIHYEGFDKNLDQWQHGDTLSAADEIAR